MGIIDYEDRYKHPLIDDARGNQDILVPGEINDIDYIYEQILYRNRLLLEDLGETFQAWKFPKAGTICDNPSCAIYKDHRQAPSANCPRCKSTGFTGGYIYQGEALISVNPNVLQFTITPSGMAKISNPKTWTMPEPELLSHDILVAVDRDVLVQDKRVVDEELVRRTDEDVSGIQFDSLSNEDILRIEKISDTANSEANYKENIDYTLSNNGILWTSFGSSPDSLDSYFVTYLVSKSNYRMFEVNSVTRSTWRGVILHQDLEITELDINHPVYDHITLRSFDDTRQQYPFPVSDWFSRE